ncbi:MAG: TRAP transporter small permease [Lachnospiraceae bacterium]|nr:TRAP transporter small permease [Lachnospiraceae bacterium OF09-6]
MKNNTFLKRFDTVIKTIENLGTGISFGCIVVLVSVSVFCRYVLKSGILWSAEIQEVLVVAMAMFGCAKATREGGHTELTALTSLFPRKGRVFIRTLTSLASAFFLIVFFWASLQYTLNTGALKTIMLKIPYKYFYMFLPIGLGLNLYEFLKKMPGRIKNDPPSDY